MSTHARGQRPVGVVPGYVEEVTEQIRPMDLPVIDAIHSGSSHAATQAAAEATAAVDATTKANAAVAASQPLDSDLTAIAALSTTTYGRAFLAMVRASDLTALTSGAAFPTGAALTAYGNNRPFFRTDLGEWYYYDGTRWLSCTLYRDAFFVYGVLQPLSANNVFGFWAPWHTTNAIWLDALYTTTNVLATNDATHYWTVALVSYPSVGFPAVFTTAGQAGSAGGWTTRRTAIGALLGSDTEVEIQAGKTSTPGNIRCAPYLTYRKIAT